MTVSVLKSTNADDVYRAVAEKIGLSKSVHKYFYIFEIVEYNFGKLLIFNENMPLLTHTQGKHIEYLWGQSFLLLNAAVRQMTRVVCVMTPQSQDMSGLRAVEEHKGVSLRKTRIYLCICNEYYHIMRVAWSCLNKYK